MYVSLLRLLMICQVRRRLGSRRNKHFGSGHCSTSDQETFPSSPPTIIFSPMHTQKRHRWELTPRIYDSSDKNTSRMNRHATQGTSAGWEFLQQYLSLQIVQMHVRSSANKKDGAVRMKGDTSNGNSGRKEVIQANYWKAIFNKLLVTEYLLRAFPGK